MTTSRHLPVFFRILFIAGAAMSIAASGAAPSKPADQFKPPELAAVIKTAIAQRLALLDQDIAERMMRRPSIPTGAIARFEMGIDLRVIARTILAVAADADAASETQIDAYLRAIHLLGAVGQTELAPPEAAPTRTQSEAMIRLHQLSYALEDAQKTAQIDLLSRNLAGLILDIASPTPVDPKSIPLMRLPAPPPKPSPNAPASSTQPASLAGLADQARRLAVSTPLRQQLLTLASQAQTLAEDPDQAHEASQLRAMLTDAINLADGLSSNTATASESRQDLETRLAEGIALFMDRRMRSAGQSKITSLTGYRRILQCIDQLKFSPEQKNLFAPAFVWAQANPDHLNRTLAAITTFVKAASRFDSLPQNPSPLNNLRKPIAELQNNFTARRTAFLNAVNQIRSATSPDDLEFIATESARAVNMLQLLQQLPQTLDTLNAYKPKPFGALEKRAMVAAVALPTPFRGPTRIEAETFLNNLTQLAALATSLANQSLEDLPATVVNDYAQKQLPAFGAKCRTLVGELASSLASTGSLAQDKFTCLNTAAALIETLRTAATLERVRDESPKLNRWADWTADTRQLAALLEPYRQATAAAFVGLVGDDPDALRNWSSLNRRFQPLLTLLLHTRPRIKDCCDLATGLLGDAGRLATPLDHQPFSAERYTSFIASLYALTAEPDPIGAEVLQIALVKYLAKIQSIPLNKDDLMVSPPKLSGSSSPSR